MFGVRYDPLEEEMSRKRLKVEVSDNSRGNGSGKTEEIDGSQDGSHRSESGSDEESMAEADVVESSSSSDSSESSDSSDNSDSSDQNDTSDEESAPEDTSAMDVDTPTDRKYSRILQRFQTSVKQSDQLDTTDEQEEQPESADLKPLAPIPQPRNEHIPKAQISGKSALSFIGQIDTFDVETRMPMNDLGLPQQILHNLKEDGINEAFAVQATVVPLLTETYSTLNSRPDRQPDILVGSPTGSGKTLSYAIPLLTALIDRVVPRLRAIIIVPTKPLVLQVRSVLDKLARGTKLKIMRAKLEQSLANEQKQLESNVPDILISTPGRLVDLISSNDGISLQDLQYVIIDEGDRLLGQSFQDWVNVLIKAIDQAHGTNSMIFERWTSGVHKTVMSATLTSDIGKLSGLKLFSPRILLAEEQQQNGMANESDEEEKHGGSLQQTDFFVPATLEEYFVPLSLKSASVKPLILWKLLVEIGSTQKTIVFTKSNDSALRLARLLQLIHEHNKVQDSSGLKITSITSSSTHHQRQRTLKDMDEKDAWNVVVSTDLVARGVDVNNLTCVINYDLPIGAREYVHRVGRTARAGKHGTAFNLAVGAGERKWFRRLRSKVSNSGAVKNYDFSEEATQQLQPAYESALRQLENEVFTK